MNKYDPNKIEAKWQKHWEKNKTFCVKEDSKKKKFYSLIEFPYPSGEGLHVGHPRPFTAMDVISRKRRMDGFNVLYPIGFDAFGLPTENHAIKTKQQPAVVTKKNIANFTRQLKLLGYSFDWDRVVDTTDPKYFKWTQWLFLQFYKHGLAYKKNQPINWCPKDKIGLANEEVVNGCCERCGTAVEQRNKEQWMLAITKYAEKLLQGLKEVDYITPARVSQENWIGKSEGALVNFALENSDEKLQVFTTRPDTLFGATFMAVSAELAKSWLDKGWKVSKEIEKYLEKTLSEQKVLDRVEKEKTGIATDKFAINPVNGKKIPVWITNYVLGGVGTGAIMAVPAHDERDFEFAKKFGLPITQVVAPYFYDSNNPPRSDKKTVKRINIQAVVKHWSEDKVIQIQWKEQPWKTFVIGGAEAGEKLEDAVKREVLEETGYKNIKSIKRVGMELRSEWFAAHKDENRYANMNVFEVELADGEKDELSAEESEKHVVAWVPYKDIPSFAGVGELAYIWKELNNKSGCFCEDGVAINSGEFSELKTAETKEKMIAWLEEKKIGKRQVNYKLRDWVFSRQRYWGEPIPLVYCEACAKNKRFESKGEEMNPGWIPVEEKSLPLELPKVDKYEPTDTGESPLAPMTDWVNTKCPRCGGKARRETDTMPNWAGSSWYFLRYTDPHNDKAFAGKDALKYWMSVDWYNGGMEHTVLHLLYSRFWNEFLFDLGLVPTSEPYKKRTSHGMILGPDGEKMSKSRGNVINPDEMIEKFGTDSFRTYIMFMGPFDQAVMWDTNGLVGVRRFLERVWFLQEKISDSPASANAISVLHRTIKKVGEDIDTMRYNTAVAALMQLTNDLMKEETIDKNTYKILIQLLSPFAPHLSEELWAEYGEKDLTFSAWPKFDPALAKSATFTLAVQINGKVRDTIEVDSEISEADVKELVLKSEKVQKWLEGKEPKKIIYIKGKLASVVI
ncbi:MAG: class I tRNA ligase family protein [Patescibacteria group bacterium]|jgi:leucyl-tRNA synthetase